MTSVSARRRALATGFPAAGSAVAFPGGRGYLLGMGAVLRTARAVKREAASIPLPPGQVVGLVLDVVLDRLHPASVLGRDAHPGRDVRRRAAGAGLALAGAGITAWAVAERRRKTTGSFALGHPEGLVTSGPYAASRHPMYLGWWLIHSGVAVSRGSAWALVTLPAGMLVEHLGALWEENMLRERFGQAYADYQRDVPRYVGSPIWLIRTSFHTARRPTPAAAAIDKENRNEPVDENAPKGTHMSKPAAKNAAT
ncbi:isoprenylcysteine carboxylmethyltransferase family protein [Arthrobacter sp. StoSoilB22]|uniref:methyltransferase family protein n=1 Tax=Arthrobacter sp. StoSoilB22 TaxID=2830996 RepID=UPI001CC6702D|nr:isoprenylcysteine carboxylmethyltransferase family protein [Arthrobacter sp. StoSoilB22]